MYITTSLKPTKLSRKLAKNLANLLGWEYHNRGRKSFYEILEEADVIGARCIIFIYEINKKPSILKSVILNKDWEFNNYIFHIKEFSNKTIKERHIAKIKDKKTQNFFCSYERMDYDIVMQYMPRKKLMVFKDKDIIYWIKGEYESRISNR